MPPKTKALKSIPKNFQGKFILESDSSTIKIMDKIVIREENLSYSTNIYEITEQENCSFKGNEIFFEETEECLPFSYLSEDSIRITDISIDTIFKISDDGVVKQLKGSLYFNIKDEYGFWITLILKENYSNHLELRLIQINDESILEEFKGKYKTIDSFTHDDRYLFVLNKKRFLSLVELINDKEYHEKLIPINFEN